VSARVGLFECLVRRGRESQAPSAGNGCPCKPVLEIGCSVHRWLHLPTQPSFHTLKEERVGVDKGSRTDERIMHTIKAAAGPMN
jgi:hypothetical protein